MRGLRTRLGLALLAGVLVWLGALAGCSPRAPRCRCRRTRTSSRSRPSQASSRSARCSRRLARRSQASPPTGSHSAADRLTGLAVALALLGVVAIAVALVKPYALVFVLPSLYAWLWLPLEGRAWQRAGAFVVGLTGPVAGVLLLAGELGTSPFEAARYVVGLATVGYVPLGSVVAALVWLAVAAQVGALAFGRYAPYAGGAAPPPSLFRRALRREG